MFIDSVKIYVKAGDGGRGCKSYYRDKYTRDGIPDGGDGGIGAYIIIRADRNLNTLIDLQYNQHFYGLKGEQGSSKKKKGKDRPPIVIRVPCGTIIKDIGTDCVLGSLDKDQQELIVAKGGKGGLGNRNKHEVTEPIAGDERQVQLDLKIIADVGVVGFPNAGKSTLISSISHARPQIAAYPFTTKSPILGVVGKEEETFVVADIPGLIKGSSEGKGLGDRFLRHIERTKILIHLVDMAAFDGRDPIEDYRAINKELKNYSPEVGKKRQVLAANKMDLETAGANLSRFKKTIRKKIYPISALNREGLEELIAAIRKELQKNSR
ncbi:MAG: GTPase ObgE [Candidatus Omnitrophota bacterium]|nr:GTPase ObgE [Candidatus Omnitrophota bacterium]MBU1929683.1 GTPase ObgE [Candidatus Omnitrophota bacterium]MBU2034657.1 GTPase ObgE [Candidatus Omnitrophota bacterium]MBU2221954.1 GTPase ObgE [Candidatus Omnitrophota bacterium]